VFAWDQHLIYFEDALVKHRRGDFVNAIESWRYALSEKECMYARWNLAQALLSIGKYAEGLDHYKVRWKLCPQMLNPGCAEIRARLPLWHGEDIRYQRLVLLGEQGFGDVIMAARYVPMLQQMGIDVVLAVPQALHRLLAPLAPIGDDGDICCPIFDLLMYLNQDADSVPNKPYLKEDYGLRNHWSIELPFHNSVSVGIAWTTGPHDIEFNRIIPLAEFKAALPDATLYALQPNERELAMSQGIIVPAYEDFADVAAVASLMDVVVCADIAAIHVAGAIGHPNAHVILPYLPSWRWLNNNVWYPQVQQHRQDEPGNWGSAFAKLRSAM
jgi:hypothetical protein